MAVDSVIVEQFDDARHISHAVVQLDFSLLGLEEGTLISISSTIFKTSEPQRQC
jgi:hypothetical protein